jgi:hypothetical protein
MARVPVDVIAAEAGVTQPTVSYWMKKYGKTYEKYGKGEFTRRTRGRRKETEPNDRDKEIVYLSSLGMPAAHIAEKHKMKRSRASFIIKTWRERGYVPPAPPYRAGDIVQFADVAVYHLDSITDTATAVATVIKEFIPTKDGVEGFWRYVGANELDIVSDPFRFYKNHQMAEIIQTAPVIA